MKTASLSQQKILELPGIKKTPKCQFSNFVLTIFPTCACASANGASGALGADGMAFQSFEGDFGISLEDGVHFIFCYLVFLHNFTYISSNNEPNTNEHKTYYAY